MTDKPILFSAPMVCAILDGRKTQTRRILKVEPIKLEGGMHDDLEIGREYLSILKGGRHFALPTHAIRIKAGDRLYVREHWRTASVHDNTPPRDLHSQTIVEYVADGGNLAIGKHRQAMHMPKWASRLTLLVTDVRVERLQDISETDAKAEGVSDEFTDYELYGQSQPYRFGYSSLWNMINGEGAWQANPWVVAYTFRPILGNIDHIGGDT